MIPENMPMKAIFFFCITSILAGCQTLAMLDSEQKILQSRLDLYAGTVRWGALEKLYVFVEPPDDGIMEIPLGLDNVRVVDYEITVPPSKLKNGRVLQSALITYVKRDEQRTKKILDNQVWKLNVEKNTWFRINPIPLFK